MIISHTKKFIFIKTNKTASTSLQVFLSQFLDKNIDIISKDLESENKKIFEISGIKDKNFDFFKNKFFFKNKKKFFKHDTSIEEIINFYGKKKLINYYKITVVRNPFDQILSSFNWHNHFRKVYKNKEALPINELIFFIIIIRSRIQPCSKSKHYVKARTFSFFSILMPDVLTNRAGCVCTNK